MGDAGFEMLETGPDKMIVANEDGVTTTTFAMELAHSVPCTREEEDAAWRLRDWITDTDEDRFQQLEIALLQFEDNPGREAFVADEIRDLRKCFAEQRGTDRWSPSLASLLARFETAEAALPE
jgi:hypothetical protein